VKILKAIGIRRIDAAQALAILRNPAIVVALGTTEAATAHQSQADCTPATHQ
jgi:hypothetical protein